MFEKPPEAVRAAAGRDHPRHRRVHDAHRLHLHPPHRRHRGLGHGLTLVLALLAAGGVLLVIFALVGRTSWTRPGAPDPAGRDAGPDARGARAAAARSSTARMRPLARRLSGIGPAVHQPQEGIGRHREAPGHGRQPVEHAHGRLPRPQGGRGRRDQPVVLFLLLRRRARRTSRFGLPARRRRALSSASSCPSSG